MWPRITNYLMCFSLLVCIIFMLHEYRYLNVSFCSPSKITKMVSKGPALNFTETILEHTRTMIKLETWDYDFTRSGVHDVDDLLVGSGGTPIRSLIVSTWRSGSSFLGDLINAIPGNFYNYEPLMIYKVRQIREFPQAANAIRIIKNMLKCNFTNAWHDKIEYFEYVRKINKSVNQIELNRRVWSKCSFKEEFCYDAGFVSNLCELFPFQSMKLVRFRLPIVEPILFDENLNVRVVFLVRDPRAVMYSRRSFCNILDCSSPYVLCSDMVNDYRAAAKLIQIYPDKLMVIRYEDLVLDIETTTTQLLQFLRLARTPSIDYFLKTHTNTRDKKPFSTFRVSKDVPFEWKTAMNYSQVENIQNVCGKAMSKWGYELAHNSSHMASGSFFPVGLRPAFI